MKEPITIISMSQLNCNQPDGETIRTFTNPNEACRYVTEYLQKELDILKKTSGTTDICIKMKENSCTDMLNHRATSKEGTFAYTIGTNEYRFAYLTIPGEYEVSDHELLLTLEAYLNTGRSSTEYRDFAKKMSEEMHRYLQNNLWKLIKNLIWQFANGRYDERNQTAHDQAADILVFMDQKGY